MKGRESDMPPEDVWSGFFKPQAALQALGLTEECGDVVEFGCGYGTFTIAAARIVAGRVFAFDIEPTMVAATLAKVAAERLNNVLVQRRDFVQQGTGLGDSSAGFAMLFNILHLEEPLRLLDEAKRVLRPDGTLAIMHWNYDPSTPRGPSMDIRPRPEQCRDWAVRTGFTPVSPELRDLPPHHYGLVFRK